MGKLKYRRQGFGNMTLKVTIFITTSPSQSLDKGGENEAVLQ